MNDLLSKVSGADTFNPGAPVEQPPVTGNAASLLAGLGIDMEAGLVEQYSLPRVYKFHSVIAAQAIPMEGTEKIGEYLFQSKIETNTLENSSRQIRVKIGDNFRNFWASEYSNPTAINDFIGPDLDPIDDEMVAMNATHCFIYKVEADRDIQQPFYVNGYGLTDEAGLRGLLDHFAKTGAKPPSYKAQPSPCVKGTIRFRYVPCRFNGSRDYENAAAQLLVKIAENAA